MARDYDDIASRAFPDYDDNERRAMALQIENADNLNLQGEERSNFLRQGIDGIEEARRRAEERRRAEAAIPRGVAYREDPNNPGQFQIATRLPNVGRVDTTDRTVRPGWKFGDMPGEKAASAATWNNWRKDQQMMAETRGIRWAIDNMGGSTTERNRMKTAALLDWDRRRREDQLARSAVRAAPTPVSFGGGAGALPVLDGQGNFQGWRTDRPAPEDRSAQYAHELELERLRVEGALERTNAEVAGRRDVAGLNNAAALERTNAEVAGRRDVAEIRAQANRDVQELKNSGALSGGGEGETQEQRIQRLAQAIHSLDVELSPDQILMLATATAEKRRAFIAAIQEVNSGTVEARSALAKRILAELGESESPPAAPARRVWTPGN